MFLAHRSSGRAAATASQQQQQQHGLARAGASSSSSSSSRGGPSTRRSARALVAARAASSADQPQHQQPLDLTNEQQSARPPTSIHAGGEASTSNSSSNGTGGGRAAAARRFSARRAFAAAASSLAVIVPGGLAGGAGGLGGGSGGGGGGGSWWGGGGGGWWSGGGGAGGDGAAGAGGAAAAAALYELAAAGDDDAGGKRRGGGKGKKKKKKKAAGNIEDQDPDSIDEMSVGRPGPRTPEGSPAGSAIAASAGVADALLTDESEYEDALEEAAAAGDPAAAAARAARSAALGAEEDALAAEERALGLGSAETAVSLEGRPRCAEVVVEGWPEVGSLPRVEELRDTLAVQEGFAFDDEDLRADASRLQGAYREYISGVSFRVEPSPNSNGRGATRVVYTVRPFKFDAIQRAEIRGATLMPQRVADEIVSSVLKAAGGPYKVDVGVLDKMRSRIEKWYQSRGLPFCYVGYFDGMDEGSLRANVVEAKVTDVTVRYRGHAAEAPTGERGGGGRSKRRVVGGEVVPAERIVKASGFKKGQHYHIDDGQDAMNNIYSCGLLEEVSVDPEQDPKDPSKIHVRINVQEAAPRSMELSLDWALPMKEGVPQLGRQNLVPGGSVDLTHENLFGNSESLSLSLSSSDWRNPAADLGYTLSFAEPFYAPRTTRNAQVFNTRKMSPVFTPGGEPDVPPVFVDRFGCKAWTSHAPGGENKVQHALILQAVSTVDENGQPVTRGTKVQRGYYADNGPLTTLSGTGRDVSLSYQGFAALDSVQFVNGNQIGTRAIAQVDQGLNLRPPAPGGGTGADGKAKRLGPLTGGVYNRAVASFTRFMQVPGLPRLTEEDVWVRRKAPTTLVLHARAGAAVGDLAAYDAFALGGPYSVRGYAPGELGACRRFLEAAAEVRYPLRNARRGLPGTAYAFVDAGTDLGSSAGVDGNPTEFYRKPGGGVGVGVGLRALGACRFEYARDCNAGTGAVFVQWGERF